MEHCPKILICPDSFKGSYSSSAVGQIFANGVRSVFPEASLTLLPVSDGGEGFLEALCSPLQLAIHQSTCMDPMGRDISVEFGLTPNGETAVVEIAQCSGLGLLSSMDRKPLELSSYGTGQVILDAAQCAPKRLWIGLGGSATVDGGWGLLQALGLSAFDDEDEILAPSGGSLLSINRLHWPGLHPAMAELEITAFVDVKTLLLGDSGAARTFAPQKGASRPQTEKLHQGLLRWSQRLGSLFPQSNPEITGGGAAGGIAFGLHAALGAQLQSGATFVLDQLGFDDLLEEADLVITGEGRLDSTTHEGKMVAEITQRAKLAEVPIVAVVGQVSDASSQHDFHPLIWKAAVAAGEVAEENHLIHTVKTMLRDHCGLLSPR